MSTALSPPPSSPHRERDDRSRGESAGADRATPRRSTTAARPIIGADRQIDAAGDQIIGVSAIGQQAELDVQPRDLEEVARA